MNRVFDSLFGENGRKRAVICFTPGPWKPVVYKKETYLVSITTDPPLQIPLFAQRAVVVAGDDQMVQQADADGLQRRFGCLCRVQVLL